MSSPVRLDKLLANLGYGSRRDIQVLARSGRVKLDGVALTRADDRITVAPDLPAHLSIDGAPVDPPPGLVLMMNKPAGLTCSHKEVGPLVYELLPPRWRLRDPPVSSVGRLDKETSGLLLLTDDGALLHKIIAPRTHLPKRYQVTLARPLQGDEVARFASGGLMLEGETKPLLPAILDVHGPMAAAVTITEGRYHQVRRMFAALGNHVTALHRDKIGGLPLDDTLGPSAYRPLGEADILKILNPNQ